MKLKAQFEKKVLKFKRPGGTSRGVLKEKPSWMLTVWEEGKEAIKGVGECNVIPKLSPDYQDDASYEEKLQEVVQHIDYYAGFPQQLWRFPSIRFGLEMALLDLKNGGKALFFDTPFIKGKQPLPINGLIWMGEPDFMREQIREKIANSSTCIKMKIGAIDFETELKILSEIRKEHPKEEMELRVDANGGFSVEEAPDKLKALSKLDIHSIEQPIKQGQTWEMRRLSELEYVPIALDEELIGVYEYEKKKQLLTNIKPHFIVLKPSLLGGFEETNEWIKLAGQQNIPWWITSALESNVGLNALAQYTATFAIHLPQGLGTGKVYSNNSKSYTHIEGDYLLYGGE